MKDKLKAIGDYIFLLVVIVEYSAFAYFLYEYTKMVLKAYSTNQ